MASSDVVKAVYPESAIDVKPSGPAAPNEPDWDGLKQDKTVKVKSLIDTRCATCHAAGKDQEEFPLDTFAGLEKYFAPQAADPKAGANPSIPAAKE